MYISLGVHLYVDLQIIQVRCYFLSARTPETPRVSLTASLNADGSTAGKGSLLAVTYCQQNSESVWLQTHFSMFEAVPKLRHRHWVGGVSILATLTRAPGTESVLPLDSIEPALGHYAGYAARWAPSKASSGISSSISSSIFRSRFIVLVYHFAKQAKPPRAVLLFVIQFVS